MPKLSQISSKFCFRIMFSLKSGIYYFVQATPSFKSVGGMYTTLPLPRIYTSAVKSRIFLSSFIPGGCTPQ